jgi:hypothetical protein
MLFLKSIAPLKNLNKNSRTTSHPISATRAGLYIEVDVGASDVWRMFGEALLECGGGWLAGIKVKRPRQGLLLYPKYF